MRDTLGGTCHGMARYDLSSNELSFLPLPKCEELTIDQFDPVPTTRDSVLAVKNRGILPGDDAKVIITGMSRTGKDSLVHSLMIGESSRDFDKKVIFKGQ